MKFWGRGHFSLLGDLVPTLAAVPRCLFLRLG